MTRYAYLPLDASEVHGQAMLQLLAGVPICGAFFWGAFYGMLVAFSPDHLGTLLTLSVASDNVSAFRVGAAWGLGHAAGAGLVLLLLFSVEYASGLSGKTWEQLSEYAIGISMIACAIYFVLRESDYIVEAADGGHFIRSCDCCPPTKEEGDAPALQQRSPRKRRQSKFCDTFGKKELGVEGTSSTVVPVPHSHAGAHQLLSWTGRDVKGAVIGVIQGFCCPMSLVGTTFTGLLGTPTVCAMFVASFLLVSTVGTGLLTMGWSSLTRSGGTWLPPRAVYRATCASTLMLGVVWIVANAMGRLDVLEWTERLMHHTSQLLETGSTKIP